MGKRGRRGSLNMGGGLQNDKEPTFQTFQRIAVKGVALRLHQSASLFQKDVPTGIVPGAQWNENISTKMNPTIEVFGHWFFQNVK